MWRTTKSSAAEQRATDRKQADKAIKERDKARLVRQEHVQKLKALRLAKEAADKETADREAAEKAAGKATAKKPRKAPVKKASKATAKKK